MSPWRRPRRPAAWPASTRRTAPAAGRPTPARSGYRPHQGTRQPLSCRDTLGRGRALTRPSSARYRSWPFHCTYPRIPPGGSHRANRGERSSARSQTSEGAAAPVQSSRSVRPKLAGAPHCLPRKGAGFCGSDEVSGRSWPPGRPSSRLATRRRACEGRFRRSMIQTGHYSRRRTPDACF